MRCFKRNLILICEKKNIYIYTYIKIERGGGRGGRKVFPRLFTVFIFLFFSFIMNERKCGEDGVEISYIYLLLHLFSFPSCICFVFHLYIDKRIHQLVTRILSVSASSCVCHVSSQVLIYIAPSNASYRTFMRRLLHDTRILLLIIHCRNGGKDVSRINSPIYVIDKRKSPLWLVC